MTSRGFRSANIIKPPCLGPHSRHFDVADKVVRGTKNFTCELSSVGFLDKGSMIRLDCG